MAEELELGKNERWVVRFKEDSDWDNQLFMSEESAQKHIEWFLSDFGNLEKEAIRVTLIESAKLAKVRDKLDDAKRDMGYLFRQSNGVEGALADWTESIEEALAELETPQ